MSGENCFLVNAELFDKLPFLLTFRSDEIRAFKATHKTKKIIFSRESYEGKQ
jgi:hypothetical protein